MLKSTKNEQEGEAETPIDNERRPLHKAFILYSVLAALVSFWMALGQIMGCFVYEISAINYVLRGYVVVSCLLLIVGELEWTSLGKSGMLHNWIGRGLIYVFIGVIGMQENQTATIVREDWGSYQVLRDIVRTVAWNMTGVGVVYFVMGIFCMQLFLDSLRRDFQARLHPAPPRDEEQEDLEAGVEVEYEVDNTSEKSDNDQDDATGDDEASSEKESEKSEDIEKGDEKSEDTEEK